MERLGSGSAMPGLGDSIDCTHRENLFENSDLNKRLITIVLLHTLTQRKQGTGFAEVFISVLVLLMHEFYIKLIQMVTTSSKEFAYTM